uniref:Bifunctional inhibitor/plant lipid transfer protein/seed storage helical domain-containing protein n=1 Tax=Oryza punctata TaxID=4537 RepID=A0A0E0KRI3_ORYPU
MASSAVVAACVVVAALLVVSVPGVAAQPGGASSGCTTSLLRLLPCLGFVGGNDAAPSDTCCANLGSMVHDEPLCLCQALSQSGGGAIPVPVNRTRAVQMPRLCRLDLPPAAGACPGFDLGGAAPSPPVSVPRSTPNSTAPSTLTPVTVTQTPPQQTTPSPKTSSQMPEYSSGLKLIVDRVFVALGFMALVSALTF